MKRMYNKSATNHTERSCTIVRHRLAPTAILSNCYIESMSSLFLLHIKQNYIFGACPTGRDIVSNDTDYVNPRQSDVEYRSARNTFSSPTTVKMRSLFETTKVSQKIKSFKWQLKIQITVRVRKSSK